MSADTGQHEEGDSGLGNGVDHDAVEALAREQGWAPKEEFRGKPERWVDAETFVQRNEHVMPILKKNNERLETANKLLESKLNNLAAELEGAKEDLETFQEFHKEEVGRRVAETRQNLLKEIKEARDEQDVDREIKATSDLSQLDAAEAEVKAAEKASKKAERAPPTQEMPETPAYLAWKAQNPWFMVDPERTFLVKQTAERLVFDIQAGRVAPVVHEAFFAELNRRLAGQSAPRAYSKVEGSRGGAGGGGPTGRTYSDLPKEAKEVCDRFAEKFVGDKRQFKTLDAYRKHYVKQLEDTGGFDN